MNNLTPVFERETGQVILEGPPAGVAGEAPLIPVPGLELAFDRADGRLCRAVAGGRRGRTDPSPSASRPQRCLSGCSVRKRSSVVSGARAEGKGTAEPGCLSSEPGLTATLSSLARLDAARVTSPVPPDSPWWAAEAAELAERGGLRARARAEAHQAVVKLLGQLDSLKALPAQAVRAAIAVASIHAVTDPQAARRLRGALKKLSGRPPGTARRRAPGSTWRPRSSAWRRTACA